MPLATKKASAWVQAMARSWASASCSTTSQPMRRRSAVTAAGRAGVQRARADHGAERALAALEAHRAEEGVGGDPRDLAAEARGHHRRGADLDAADVEDDLIRRGGAGAAPRGTPPCAARAPPARRSRRPRRARRASRAPASGTAAPGSKARTRSPASWSSVAEGGAEAPVAEDGDGAHRAREDRFVRAPLSPRRTITAPQSSPAPVVWEAVVRTVTAFAWVYCLALGGCSTRDPDAVRPAPAPATRGRDLGLHRRAADHGSGSGPTPTPP